MTTYILIAPILLAIIFIILIIVLAYLKFSIWYLEYKQTKENDKIAKQEYESKLKAEDKTPKNYRQEQTYVIEYQNTTNEEKSCIFLGYHAFAHKENFGNPKGVRITVISDPTNTFTYKRFLHKIFVNKFMAVRMQFESNSLKQLKNCNVNYCELMSLSGWLGDGVSRLVLPTPTIENLMSNHPERFAFYRSTYFERNYCNNDFSNGQYILFTLQPKTHLTIRIQFEKYGDYSYIKN